MAPNAAACAGAGAGARGLAGAPRRHICLERSGGDGSGGGGAFDASTFEHELNSGAGFVCLKGVVSPLLAARAREYVTRLNRGLSREAGHMCRTTSDSFLHSDPRLVGELLSALFAPLEACLAAQCGDDWTVGAISSLTLFRLQPDEAKEITQQDLRGQHFKTLHSDYPYGHVYVRELEGKAVFHHSERTPPTCTVLLMLDAFSDENGSTHLLPGSQRKGRTPHYFAGGDLAPREKDFAAFMEGAEVVTGQIGDVMVYNGNVWHTVSGNRTSRPRCAVIAQVNPDFFQQMENHAWTLPPRSSRLMPAAVLQRLGVNTWHGERARFGLVPRTPLKAAQFAWDTVASSPFAFPKKHWLAGMQMYIARSMNLRNQISGEKSDWDRCHRRAGLYLQLQAWRTRAWFVLYTVVGAVLALVLGGRQALAGAAGGMVLGFVAGTALVLERLNM